MPKNSGLGLWHHLGFSLANFKEGQGQEGATMLLLAMAYCSINT